MILLLVMCAFVQAQEIYLDKLPAELLVKVFESAPAAPELIFEYKLKKDPKGTVYPFTKNFTELIERSLYYRNKHELYHIDSGLTFSPKDFTVLPHFAHFNNKKYDYKHIQDQLKTYLISLIDFYKDASTEDQEQLKNVFMKALNSKSKDCSINIFNSTHPHDLIVQCTLSPTTLGQLALLLCIKQDHRDTYYGGDRFKYPKLCNWNLIKDILVKAGLISAEIRDAIIC